MVMSKKYIKDIPENLRKYLLLTKIEKRAYRALRDKGHDCPTSLRMLK